MTEQTRLVKVAPLLTDLLSLIVQWLRPYDCARFRLVCKQWRLVIKWLPRRLYWHCLDTDCVDRNRPSYMSISHIEHMRLCPMRIELCGGDTRSRAHCAKLMGQSFIRPCDDEWLGHWKYVNQDELDSIEFSSLPDYGHPW